MTEEIYKNPEIKLIIAGSNHFNNYSDVESKLIALGVDKQECLIVTEMRYGVSMMGFDFARKYNKPIWIYKDTKSMVKVSTHCIVIWDGVSEEAKEIIELSKKYKLKLIEIKL